jgi:hypothetical protein
MPHRVVTFFRSHANNNSFDPQTELKKTPRRSSSRRPSFSNRTPSSSASSIISEDSKSVNMPDGHGRLLSLTGLHSPKPSSNKLQPQPASLDVLIESPPLVFYGQAATSTGALLSGQLTLDIHDESLAIDAFKMRLACEVTRKKPFHAHCQECQHQSTDLTTWTFLQGPATLRKGESNGV